MHSFSVEEYAPFKVIEVEGAYATSIAKNDYLLVGLSNGECLVFNVYRNSIKTIRFQKCFQAGSILSLRVLSFCAAVLTCDRVSFILTSFKPSGSDESSKMDRIVVKSLTQIDCMVLLDDGLCLVST